MARRQRTNLVLDQDLVEKVMRLYGMKSKREAVDYALRQLVEDVDPYALALQLRGIGWDADLDELRGSRPIPEW